MNKLKTFLFDHFHILFKSAADNHLRIQKIIKESNGAYNLTLHFDSYSDLKNYQKKVRRASIGLSSATAMIIVAFIISPYITNPNRSSAANFQWMQNSWSGGIATSGATKTGWTKYASKDANINAAANSVSMTQPIPATTGDANYQGVVATGFYVDASNRLVLKKVQGATCGSATECLTGLCLNSVCCQDACCGVSSVQYNNDTYPTILIGSQCWLKESLRTTLKPDGVTSITTYCNPNGCVSPRGRHYDWNVAMNGASAATGVGAKIQGICPPGWHIPSDFNSSDDFGVLTTFIGNDGQKLKQTGTTYWASPNAGTNTTNFSALGEDLCDTSGVCQQGKWTYNMWTSKQYDASNATFRRLSYNDGNFSQSSNSKNLKLSVRCIKN